MMGRRIIGLLALILVSGMAHAHKPSDSYLQLTVEPESPVIEGRWDIALRDLEHTIGLDGDGDGEITWNELQSSHTAIAGHVLSRLSLYADGDACELTADNQQVVRHGDGMYTVLAFQARCGTAPSTVSASYSLFAESDPSHRGLLQLESGGNVQVVVLGPDNPTAEMTVGEGSIQAGLGTFVWEGIWHIWIGFDHVAFLILLLLPSALTREKGRWTPKHGVRDVIIDVAGVVTAFTLAHSITLSLAALDIVVLPIRWVELVIAASVVLAALYTLFPLPIRRGRWMIAFGFGLVHGFGFASVLGGLGLDGANLAVVLAGFNVGVEIGQIAIVLVVVPMIYTVRRTWLYQRLVLPLGAVVIGGWGVLWFVQRLLG